MRTAIRFITLSFIAMSFTACGGGGGGGSSSRGVAGKVRIGQIGSTNASLMALAASTWGDVAQSAGNYSWVKVDGLKVELQSVHGTVAGKREEFVSFSPAREIELKNDEGAVSIQNDITVPSGTYSDVGVTFKNGYSVKGFCRTNNKSLYTTAAGIKECTSNCGASDNLPGDYDYYTYNFMLAEAPNGSTVMETNKLTFSVAEGDSPKLTLLVDTSYTLSCADADANINSTVDTGTMAPFSWSTNSPKTTYFTGTEGNFGSGYVALFTYVSTNINEALPVGETYVSSGRMGDIVNGSETADLVKSLITTVAVDANDNIIAMRSRNFDGGHDTGLQQGWSGFSTDAPNSYTMMNGEHWEGAAANYSEARWLQDRKIVGFQRSMDYTVRQTFNVEDGPDCGQNLGGHSQTCLGNGNSITTYWKRIRR